MRKHYWLVLAVVILVLSCIWSTITNNKQYRRDLDLLYDSDIEDQIENISFSAGVTYIKLSGKNDRIAFKPISSRLNQNSDFNTLAERGDMIVKRKGSDTLKLIRRGKIYRYTFK